MAIPQKIIKFLEKNKVKYEPVKHKTVYTAHDKAATLRVPEKIVGKTLVMKFDRNVGLVLIPVNKNLDKVKFKKVAKAKSVDFVKEAWMKKNLKGVKVGAFPPFGNLFKLSTFVDRGLMRQSEIIVNGGDYIWSIKITPANFKKLVPDLVIGNFSKAK
ncbi:MAG: YbaK/EbsC family protein [bacterium]|nr:YbaK/EbsC family protein [bacterium]